MCVRARARACVRVRARARALACACVRARASQRQGAVGPRPPEARGGARLKGTWPRGGRDRRRRGRRARRPRRPGPTRASRSCPAGAGAGVRARARWSVGAPMRAHRRAVEKGDGMGRRREAGPSAGAVRHAQGEQTRSQIKTAIRA